MAQKEPIRGDPTATEIPDKLYFRIGDVAKLCDVPAYVLRFWETEFPQLKPNKGGTGQRLYRRRDVEMALQIKRLLYDEGYTIPGARQFLKGEQRQSKEPQLALAIEGPAIAQQTGDARIRQRMQRLRKELEELHAQLSRAPEAASPAAVHTMRSHRGARATHDLKLAPVAAPSKPSSGDLFERQPSLLSFPEAPVE